MFLVFFRLRNSNGTIRGELGIFDSRAAHRAAWILAGGRSSRMGTDKALIEVEGSTLLARVASVVAQVCASVTVVGDPNRYGESGFPVISDRFPGLGPLGGIEAALAATSAEANLIVACDMPNIRADALEELFAAGGDIAVPRHEDHKLEPLCAVYSVRCHARVREMLESGVRSVNAALRLLESDGFAIRYVRVPGDDTFANLNTPDDLAHYDGKVGHG